MKKLVPTILMLLLSLALLATSTYAWFSMNNRVTATGMEIQAKAEAGLLISNAVNGDYGVTTDAVNPSAVVYPVTTADFTAWYKAYSTEENNAMAGITSESYVAVGNETYPASDYYLQNSFWLKASTPDGDLRVAIDGVTVTNKDTSAQFDASLRVALLIGSDIFVYAPIAGDDAQNNRAAGYNATWSTITDSAAKSNITDHITATPTELKVFCYFEGEDINCKSTNLRTVMDTLEISFDVVVLTD